MLWLHLHFPQLPLEVFNLDRDDVAVVVSEKRLVCRCNKRASEHGIRPGISVATARALHDNIRILERRPRSEHALLGNLADWAYSYSSLVSVEPPDGVVLEVAGSERLFGDLKHLLNTLTQGLEERGISYQHGLAPSPEGARLLALSGMSEQPGDPDCLIPTDVQAYRNTISRLSLEALDCSPRQLQRLQQAGLSSIGDIMALPRASIGKRFGQEFLNYIRRLNIEQHDARKAYSPPEKFHSVLHFPDPVQNNAGLLFPMQRLLRELEQFLARRQAFARQIIWRFIDTANQPHEMPVRCSLQHNSIGAMLELTRLTLDNIKLGSMVESIALECRQFSLTEQLSDQLFADHQSINSQQQQDAFRLLLDRLSLRLGRDAIYTIQPRDGHLPEFNWRLMSAGDHQHATTTTTPVGSRPLWLLPTPQPLRAHNGTVYNKRALKILNGPERIESGWWESVGSIRDYYIAIEDDGALCWIYKDNVQAQWYLHGYFG